MPQTTHRRTRRTHISFATSGQRSYGRTRRRCRAASPRAPAAGGGTPPLVAADQGRADAVRLPRPGVSTRPALGRAWPRRRLGGALTALGHSKCACAPTVMATSTKRGRRCGTPNSLAFSSCHWSGTQARAAGLGPAPGIGQGRGVPGRGWLWPKWCVRVGSRMNGRPPKLGRDCRTRLSWWSSWSTVTG
jgi:hypothetical protein